MAEMRQRTEIMPSSIGNEKISTAGMDTQSVNMVIVVELMLDIRQISAAQFVVANGGTIPTPSWLEDIAKGL